MKHKICIFILILLKMWSIPSMAEVINGRCGGYLTWTLDSETNTLTIIGKGDMYDWTHEVYVPWFQYKSYITYIILPNGLTSIGNRAFYDCKSLTSIEIPNSVTSIGSYAFEKCIGLTSIEIPISVTSIEEYAFHDCKSLTSLTIPSSVTIRGLYALYIPIILQDGVVKHGPYCVRI